MKENIKSELDCLTYVQNSSNNNNDKRLRCIKRLLINCGTTCKVVQYKKYVRNK